MGKFEGFQKGVNLGGWISQFAKYDKIHFESFKIGRYRFSGL